MCRGRRRLTSTIAPMPDVATVAATPRRPRPAIAVAPRQTDGAEQKSSLAKPASPRERDAPWHLNPVHGKSADLTTGLGHHGQKHQRQERETQVPHEPRPHPGRIPAGQASPRRLPTTRARLRLQPGPGDARSCAAQWTQARLIATPSISPDATRDTDVDRAAELDVHAQPEREIEPATRCIVAREEGRDDDWLEIGHETRLRVLEIDPPSQ